MTRDPFDRLLLAQCSIEELRLVTVDRALTSHALTIRRRTHLPDNWTLSRLLTALRPNIMIYAKDGKTQVALVPLIPGLSGDKPG